MTQTKKLKKSVRARARKTGESYTAARRQVLQSRNKLAERAPRARPATSKAKGAVSDAAVLKKTGHGLAHWFAVLEAYDPKAKGHTDRALFLYEEHGVPGWHAQGITVAYERERGLRVMNQTCDGDFEVSVSKTLPVSVEEVAAAIGDARRRATWLKSADDGLRRALEAAFRGPKAKQVTIKDVNYARLRYPWDGGAVEIRIYGKKSGASVVADNKSLPRAEIVEQRRAQWKNALESLQRHFGR
jgi:hypothetical protein